MVQLSRSLSLVSSCVSLSNSAFSLVSSRFCAVKVMFSLLCSDIIVFTAVRRDNVTVAFTHHYPRCLSRQLHRQTLTVDTKGDDDWHQDHTNNPQTCCCQMKRSIQQSFLFIVWNINKNNIYYMPNDISWLIHCKKKKKSHLTLLDRLCITCLLSLHLIINDFLVVWFLYKHKTAVRKHTLVLICVTCRGHFRSALCHLLLYYLSQ